MFFSGSRIQECHERHGSTFHEQPYILYHTSSDQPLDTCAWLVGQKWQELCVESMTVGSLQGSQEVQQRQTLGQ